jgi:hypothetical protein
MKPSHAETLDISTLNLKPGQSVLVERTIQSVHVIDSFCELKICFEGDDRPHFMRRGERPWCRLDNGNRVRVLIKAFARIPEYARLNWLGLSWVPKLLEGSIYLFVLDLEKIR